MNLSSRTANPPFLQSMKQTPSFPLQHEGMLGRQSFLWKYLADKPIHVEKKFEADAASFDGSEVKLEEPRSSVFGKESRYIETK